MSFATGVLSLFFAKQTLKTSTFKLQSTSHRIRSTVYKLRVWNNALKRKLLKSCTET